MKTKRNRVSMGNSRKEQTKKNKAFSLVELVVVILIIAVLAVAVFAGGSAAIKKSQVARTTSDLHNFSIAAETTLTSTPSVANITNNSMGDGGMAKVVNEFNDLLAADYKLMSMTPLTSADLGNIQIVADTADTGAYAIFQSAKTDAWDNPYYVIFDSTERHDGTSDFTITVVSAGSNAITKVGGEIEKDDVFMLAETSDSSVASVILKASDIGDVQCPLGARKVVGNSASSNAAATYAGAAGLTTSAVASLAAGSEPEPAAPPAPVYYTVSLYINTTLVQELSVPEGESVTLPTLDYHDWQHILGYGGGGYTHLGYDRTYREPQMNMTGVEFAKNSSFTPTGDTVLYATFEWNGCFIAGTQVLMADGNTKNIEDVVIGDRVVSYNVYTKEFYNTTVIELYKEEINHNYFCVETESGNVVYPTSNHPFLTTEGFKTIVETNMFGVLHIGDTVITVDGPQKVVSITEVENETENKKRYVYSIDVMDDDEEVDCDTVDTFVAEGFVVHNPVH